VVGFGYWLGPALDLDARSLTRFTYHLLLPAFAFGAISGANVPLARMAHLAGVVLALNLCFPVLGWAAARLLRRSREVTAAYVMLATFGNIGNFGLALTEFRYGKEAVLPATVYFVVSLTVSFVVCVWVAATVRGGSPARAALSVVRTPAIVAVVPALLLSGSHVTLPLLVTRTVGLLSGATIPTMLFALGVQLGHMHRLRMDADVLASAAVRLLLAPALAAALVPLLGVGRVERAVCVLQAAMPAAVLVGIIATEYDVAANFVMTSIFWSTVLSIPVLTVLLAVL
jgi:predicted permease